MSWKYAVTFESMTQPPRTFRGEVDASTYQAAVGKAIRDAGRQKKTKTSFISIVVLVEKMVEDEGLDAGDDGLDL